MLVRSILVRPDQPAVIILGHFSPQVQQAHAFHGPEILHTVVAQFYDVPHISTKPSLFPSWLAKPSSISAYYADPVLASAAGHELLAEVLIAYIQSQVCAAWSVATGYTYDVVLPLLPPMDALNPNRPPTDARLFGGMGQRVGLDGLGGGGGGAFPDAAHNPHLHVPIGRISSRPTDERRFHEVAPFCVSSNDLINPLPPSLFTGSGWLAHHPAGGAESALAHYWYSTLPGSKLRVPIQCGAGDIAVYYLREPLADVGGTGSGVECWVDDNYKGAKMLLNGAEIDEALPTCVSPAPASLSILDD